MDTLSGIAYRVNIHRKRFPIWADSFGLPVLVRPGYGDPMV